MSLKSPQEMACDLGPKLSGNVCSDIITRTIYSTDGSMFKIIPALVVEPKNVDDVKKIVLYASENKIPLAPRGGGTGLAGESLTNGIVIDFSVFMNRIKEINLKDGWARVEPGVVPGNLNRELLKDNLIFGPDPSTVNFCTIGGMIANNSTGAHSLRYGMTNKWILSITLMLYDGTVFEFSKENINSQSFQKLLNSSSTVGKIYKKVISEIKNSTDLIQSTWPRAPRNRHGYNLKDVCTNDGQVDLTQLICGAEGTLGIILEAKIKLVSKDPYSDLIGVTFKNRMTALEAVPAILNYSPSALEIIDEKCLNMARENRVYQDLYPPHIGAVLLVEFDDNNQEEIEKSIENIEKKFVQDLNLAVEVQRCESKEKRDTIWKMRKLIAGMISQIQSRFRPFPIIEDVCVHPSELPKFVKGVENILKKWQLEFLCYGHAGDGIVHLRPFLDIKSSETYKWLPQMCDKVYDLALELSGTISGEHGDGLLRAPFIKKQYGKLFDTFLEIKKTFDPTNIFNPNKKTGCTDFDHWSEDVRYGEDYKLINYSPKLVWPLQSLQKTVETCNGCGACRNKIVDESQMCPMFRAFGKEIATPRAKANIMRAFLSGEFDKKELKDLLDVGDYCINCKMCLLDCPANIKIADLMVELKANLRSLLGTPLDIRMLALSEKMVVLGSLFPKIFNYFSQTYFVRKVLKLIGGVTDKRTPPCLSEKSFKQVVADRQEKIPKKKVASDEKIVYFIDTYAAFINTNIIDSVFKVMKANNIEVVIPDQKSCGIIQYNYGLIDQAKKLAKFNLQNIIEYVRQGYKVICTEPTAALMLKEEYQAFDDSKDFKLLADATYEMGAYLYKLYQSSRLNIDFGPIPHTFGYHMPCHLKKINDKSYFCEVLKLIPKIDVYNIDKGCCGIAGTFGMREKGYQTSLMIGEKLFYEMRNPDIDFGLTECSTCRMQIKHAVSEKQIFHPIEVLAMAIKWRQP